MRKVTLIILVGISGSGKSTWLKSLDLSQYKVVCPDEIRRELTGDVSDQTRNDYVIFLANKSIVDNLNDGHDVILDATNVRSRERRSLLKYLKENVTVDFDALAKVFYVDPEICKIRIKLDMKNNVDRSNVPDYAIDRQYARFIGGLDKIESEGYKLI